MVSKPDSASWTFWLNYKKKIKWVFLRGQRGTILYVLVRMVRALRRKWTTPCYLLNTCIRSLLAINFLTDSANFIFLIIPICYTSSTHAPTLAIIVRSWSYPILKTISLGYHSTDSETEFLQDKCFVCLWLVLVVKEETVLHLDFYFIWKNLVYNLDAIVMPVWHYFLLGKTFW